MPEIDVGEILTNLSSTDEDVAYLEGEMLRLERKVDRVKDALYLGSSGTIAERKAMANKSPEIAVLEDELVEATVKFKSLRAKRETWHTQVDVWRSLNAARRQGV